MIKRLIQYITHDIWFKQEKEYKSKKTRWAVRQMKVILFAAQGFGEHGILIRSAALTFYTLMALVPIAALAFSVAKGFGLDSLLSEYLHGQFPQYTILIDQILIFADALLERTKGGLIASVGIVVLFWSVVKVFNNVEDAFNKIWEIRKTRSFTRKISDYMAILLLSPLLLVLSNSFVLQLRTHLLNISNSLFVQLLFGLLSIAVICLMFAFIYYKMPNTKVKMRSALNAGLIAGISFQIFQWVYVFTQSEVSNFNAIYGTFSAIPLFLIWTQVSWQILLIGAELSFSFQNIKKFEYEKLAGNISYHFRKNILLAVMYRITIRFLRGEESLSSEGIAQELNLPVRFVRDAVFDLEKCGLIVAIMGKNEKTNFYMPAHDMNDITVYDVIKEVEMTGTDSLAGLEESPEMRGMNAITRTFDRILARSSENTLLKDIKLESAES